MQPDGKLIVAGDFTTIGGQTRHRVARLDADGHLDTDFVDAFVDGPVDNLALRADGKLFVGGSFDTIDGQAHKRVARLNADGSLDETFADVGTNGWIGGLAVQADGKLVIGGHFTTFGGQTRNNLARLSLPEAALQSLDADADTVTWRRAGSAPELAAPPFLARSTDGIAYDAPGPMTHVGDGWLLDGVALPANGFAWLRVDGVLSGGAGANSRGVVDGVRQLWRSDRLFADGFE